MNIQILERLAIAQIQHKSRSSNLRIIGHQESEPIQLAQHFEPLIADSGSTQEHLLQVLVLSQKTDPCIRHLGEFQPHGNQVPQRLENLQVLVIDLVIARQYYATY